LPNPSGCTRPWGLLRNNEINKMMEENYLIVPLFLLLIYQCYNDYKMCWVGHITHVWKIINSFIHKIFYKSIEGRESFEDLALDGRIMLRLILNK
jgi:hypothetical protein